MYPPPVVPLGKGDRTLAFRQSCTRSASPRFLRQGVTKSICTPPVVPPAKGTELWPLARVAHAQRRSLASPPSRRQAGSESNRALLRANGQSKGPKTQTSRGCDANPRERDRKAPRTHLKWPSVDQSQRMQRSHNSEDAPGEPKISSTTHISPPAKSRATALAPQQATCRTPSPLPRGLFAPESQAARLAAGSGAFTVNTGHGARRTTFSATEPRSR